MSSKFNPPTLEQRQKLLEYYGESERMIKESERSRITATSRQQAVVLEREGFHPKRIMVGKRNIAWLLSDVLFFIYKDSEEFGLLNKTNNHN